MAIKNVLPIILVLIAACLVSATETGSMNNYPGDDLDDSGQAAECLEAIRELNSCSNVIAEYFTVGRADIAHCCDAIDNVTSKCSSWPDTSTSTSTSTYAHTYTSSNTLQSLGYTEQESNVIGSYCGKASSPDASPAPF